MQKNILAWLLLAALPLSSCVMVGGYSSNGGWFFWPGGWIGVLVMIAVAVISFFLFKR